MATEMTPADAVAKPDATAEAKSSGHGESKSQMLDQDRDGRLYWLWLVFCFSGIMVAFICYGIVMEYAECGDLQRLIDQRVADDAGGSLLVAC